MVQLPWRFLKILKETYHEIWQFPSGFLPKSIESIRREICTLVFTAASFTAAKTWKQPVTGERVGTARSSLRDAV